MAVQTENRKQKTENAIKPSRNDSFGSRTLLWGCGALLGLLVLVGSFYNLANYPTIWWDEAIFSETAANLAQHGRYAFTVQSPDQLNDLDFRISVGPAVVLPVALAYKLLGVNLGAGRMVAGTYLVLAFLALFLVARRLWSADTALLAVALALGGTDVLYWGRSVLGDIPALALFLGSLVFLSRGLESPDLWPLVLGGVFMGLAFDAKEFYGLAFLPPLVILARQTWQDQRRLALRVLAFVGGAALPLLAYLLLKAVILGSLTAAMLHFLAQKKLLCHEFFTPLTLGRIYPESLLLLFQDPLFWLGILGVAWIWRKETPSPGITLWIWNFLLWSAIYLTAVYWHRFALPALFLASPLAAYFLKQAPVRLSALIRPRPPCGLAAGIMAAVLLVFFSASGLDYFKQILSRRTEAPVRLVQYLQTHVPGRCLIETPEYELAFLDDHHRIHLMPAYYFVESTPERVVLLNPRKEPYDFEQAGAEVLVLGSFGKSVFRQVYPAARVNRDWRRIAQVDYYDIYVLRKSEKKMLQLIKQTMVSCPQNSQIRIINKNEVPKTPLNRLDH
ncbi:MAG: glycosyltransferase family 39 protein [Deltaproteobacteria bacterium]